MPSQKPVPAAKSFGAKNFSLTFTVLISWLDTTGTNKVKTIKIPKIIAPATDDLFFLNLRKASLMNVVGLDSNFLSEILTLS